MFNFKFLPLFLCFMVISSSLVISINTAPTKSVPSTLEIELSDATTTPSTISRLLSYPKKAASKTFETVGTFLSMIGESFSSEPEEAIPAEPEKPSVPAAPGKSQVQYPLEDDNPYLDTASKNEPKFNVQSDDAAAPKEEEKKGIFEKIGETFENLI